MTEAKRIAACPSPTVCVMDVGDSKVGTYLLTVLFLATGIYNPLLPGKIGA